MYLFLNEVKFNLRIKLSCLHKFSLSNNYMSSLRTTTCDALIVPSDYDNAVFFALLPIVLVNCWEILHIANVTYFDNVN